MYVSYVVSTRSRFCQDFTPKQQLSEVENQKFNVFCNNEIILNNEFVECYLKQKKKDLAVDCGGF